MVVLMKLEKASLLLAFLLPLWPAEKTKVVHMVAERFTFVPSRVKVKQGTAVEFRIRSEDTNHGFRIPAAGIDVIIPKRGKGEAKVIFHASARGRFSFECSKPCGAGHNMMRGVIIVE